MLNNESKVCLVRSFIFQIGFYNLDATSFLFYYFWIFFFLISCNAVTISKVTTDANEILRVWGEHEAGYQRVVFGFDGFNNFFLKVSFEFSIFSFNCGRFSSLKKYSD